MAVRTALLARARPAAAATFVVIYTCPVGYTAIVKDVAGFFLSGTTQSAYLQAYSGGSDYNLGIWIGAFPAAIRAPMWVVLEPGDQLRVWQTLANGMSWWISGTELYGVAP